jgi:three-Cys-motif partner protein
MPDEKRVIAMPESYRGREQAYVKHRLLETYIEKLFLIVGLGAKTLGIKELAYVDCFAGPWGDESESLDSTSIAISLRVLSRCRTTLLGRGIDLAFRALYVEKDRKAFARLKQYLSDREADGVEAEALPGDFVDLVPSIQEWTDRESFAFFFIDPKAWRPVSVGVLKPLLQRAHSEFLINLMYDFVNRAVSMAVMKPQIEELLGESPDVDGLPSVAREKELLSIYRRNLKRLIPTELQWPARSAYARVLDPEKDRPKYHLVYLTTHPRGQIEFMDASEKLDLIQKQVRADTKQRSREEKSHMQGLFDDAEQVRPEDGHVSLEEVESYWLRRLAEEPRRISQAEFADMLEETDWFPGDFQRALGNLMKRGVVRNLDALGTRRTKFLHLDNEGERLQLMKESA